MSRRPLGPSNDPEGELSVQAITSAAGIGVRTKPLQTLEPNCYPPNPRHRYLCPLLPQPDLLLESAPSGYDSVVGKLHSYLLKDLDPSDGSGDGGEAHKEFRGSSS